MLHSIDLNMVRIRHKSQDKTLLTSSTYIGGRCCKIGSICTRKKKVYSATMHFKLGPHIHFLITSNSGSYMQLHLQFISPSWRRSHTLSSRGPLLPRKNAAARRPVREYTRHIVRIRWHSRRLPCGKKKIISSSTLLYSGVPSLKPWRTQASNLSERKTPATAGVLRNKPTAIWSFSNGLGAFSVS